LRVFERIWGGYELRDAVCVTYGIFEEEMLWVRLAISEEILNVFFNK
jgi:hypothetical protein